MQSNSNSKAKRKRRGKGKYWVSQYSGNSIIHAYKRHFKIPLITAINDLEAIGVKLSETSGHVTTKSSICNWDAFYKFGVYATTFAMPMTAKFMWVVVTQVKG